MKVYKHGKQFTSIEQLFNWRAMRRNLSYLGFVPDCLLKKLAESIPDHIFEVINQNGAATFYWLHCHLLNFLFLHYHTVLLVCCCLLRDTLALPRHFLCQNVFLPEMFAPPGLQWSSRRPPRKTLAMLPYLDSKKLLQKLCKVAMLSLGH